MDTESGQSLASILDDSSRAAAQKAERSEPVERAENTESAPPADPTPSTETNDNGPHVPRQALEDERKKRQELERQVAEFKQRMTAPQPTQQPHPQVQQPEIPDPYLEPERFAAYQAYQVQERLFAQSVVMSQRIMRQQHADYDDAEKEFVAAVEADPMLASKLLSHPFPAEFAYQEGKRLKALKEIGDDPASFRERVRQEILAEMQGSGAQAPAQAQPARAPVPKSLASAQTGGPARDARTGRFAGPASLEDILG